MILSIKMINMNSYIIVNWRCKLVLSKIVTIDNCSNTLSIWKIYWLKLSGVELNFLLINKIV